MSDPTGQPAPPARPGRPARRGPKDRARLAAGAIVLVAATGFVLSNTQKVKIDWVVTTSETPLIVALMIAVLFGALLGLLAVRQRRRRPPGDS